MGINRRVWALLAAVVVLAGLTGCSGQYLATGQGSTGVRAEQNPADAISRWGQGGGGEAAMKVARATELVGTAGNDAALARSYCVNLDEVVAGAQKYPPIPDAEAQRLWSRGLGYARDAARSCVTAANTGSRAYAQRTIDASNQCKAEFERLTARVEAVQAAAGWR